MDLCVCPLIVSRLKWSAHILFENQLELPKSIILLKNAESIVQEKLEKERRPFLVAGSIIDYNEFPQFSFQVMINCNHSKLWLVFTSIIQLIPEPIQFSIGDYESLSEIAGSYSNGKLINILSKYSELLSNDTGIQMLINHQSSNSAFQLYASDCKYFEIYTSDDSKLINVMIDLGLPEIKNLATVDEFPRTMTGQPIENTQSLLMSIKTSLEKI
jgi:hypothetical protein